MRHLIVYTSALVIAAHAPPVAAADTGTIKGRVVNETTGEPQPHVSVTLVSGTADDVTRMETRTDEDGRYVFEDLPTGDERFYALDARYDGRLFAGRPIALPGDTATSPVVTSTLRVWETTTDSDAISVARDDLFVRTGRGGLGIVESLVVVNSASRAYIGRAGRTSLGFALPVAARGSAVTILDADIDVPVLLPTDFGAGITIAIPPGESQFTFGYEVPGTAGSFDLTRVALYPTQDYNVHTTDSIELESNRLTENGEVTIAGDTYQRWSVSEALDAGDQIQMTAVVAGEGASWWMAALIAAVLVTLGGAGTAIARRKRRGPPDRSSQDGRASRDDLLVAIAELDVRYRSGELPMEQWSEERQSLKARLSQISGEETDS